MRKKTISGSIRLFLLFFTGWLIISSIVSCQGMIERGIKNGFNRQHNEWLDDGNMHVILIGSGGPMINTERVSTSTAVIAGGEFIMVDAGDGSSRAADLQNLPLGRLSAVFLTHFHSDHIADLGELNFNSWAMGRSKELEVYGPEGVKKVLDGFSLAYELDTKYRVEHHGRETMNPEKGKMSVRTFSISAPEKAELIFDRKDLRVWAFLVDHFPAKPAVGYRFEYRGNIVVLTGDTKKTETLPVYASGADILIAEAISKKMTKIIENAASENNLLRIAKIMHDVPDYHMSPVEAAEVAREAGARILVFNHIAPPVTNLIMKRMFMDGVDDVFDGDIELGKDGMAFVLKPKN